MGKRTHQVDDLSKMKKILIFHPALAPYRIDYFNFLNDLFEIEIVFVFDNVWNHRFDQENLLGQLNCSYSFLLKGPEYKGRVFRFGIIKLIRKFKPDCIISYEYSFTTQYLIALKSLGIIDQKIGTTVDDSIQICENVQSRFRFLARKYSINKLDFIIVLSKEVADYYRYQFKIPEKGTVIFPIFQSPDRLRSNSKSLEQIATTYTDHYDLMGKKVLLFVGRFISQKNLPFFLKTISPVLLNEPNLILILVGDGEDKPSLISIIEKYGLKSKVILPGRFEGEELLAWYLCASGFVLPSIYEPFGAVVNEALIFGLNVFCSKYAGSASLLEDNLNLLFDPDDEIDTIQRIGVFLENIKPLATLKLDAKPANIVFKRDFIENELKKI